MAGQKANIQDPFLNELRKSQRPVRLMMTNGKEIRGIITAFDQFTMNVQLTDGQVLVYKSALAVIAPDEPCPETEEGAADAGAPVHETARPG